MTARMTAEMSPQEAALALADGNIGAATVCGRLLAETPVIDERIMLGGLQYLAYLDTFGLAGVRIWRLYKYVCSESLVAVIALFRGNQLGLVAQQDIIGRIDSFETETMEHRPLLASELTDLIANIRKYVPKFAPGWTPAASVDAVGAPAPQPEAAP